MSESLQWWGDFEFAVGERRQWQIGPLDLRIARRAVEWHVAWFRGPDAAEKACVVGAPIDEEIPEGFESRRLAGATADAPLQVSVRLPERPFICRPEDPFAIVPGGEVTIYISTPVTVVLGQRGTMVEILAYRPSDTWLGATPRAGELAYFTRTHAATSLAKWVPNPSRALSALSLRNLTQSSVEMDRLSLPVPQLSVFADAQGVLHTEDVDVEFREVTGKVVPEVSLRGEHADWTLVGESRVKPDRARLSGVLWGLFS